MIGRATRLLGLLLVMAASGQTSAESFPKVLFGNIDPGADTGSFAVEEQLLQLQLSPRWVVSAGRGALFNVAAAPETGSVLLTVNGGSVMALDLENDQVAALPPGSYHLDPREDASGNPAIVPPDPQYRQGFALANWVLVRQQTYLDSLRLDVRDLTHGLASILRALANRKP